jgi:ribosomal protein S18 acetylase RimI-like enzyme
MAGMMQRPPIVTRPATAADRPLAAGILARAFIDDPALSYLFTDAADRPRRLARFFALITSIDATPDLWTLAADESGAESAVALWRPPGQWKTPTAAMLAQALPLVQVFGWSLARALAMQGQIEAHHPHPPHWYLQFVGCVPERHGRGLGGAVIRARLAQCDHDGLPAALETATPANVGIYEALGFVVTGTYRIKGGGPEFWSMWREPQ